MDETADVYSGDACEIDGDRTAVGILHAARKKLGSAESYVSNSCAASRDSPYWRTKLPVGQIGTVGPDVIATEALGCIQERGNGADCSCIRVPSLSEQRVAAETSAPRACVSGRSQERLEVYLS